MWPGPALLAMLAVLGRLMRLKRLNQLAPGTGPGDTGAEAPSAVTMLNCMVEAASESSGCERPPLPAVFG